MCLKVFISVDSQEICTYEHRECLMGINGLYYYPYPFWLECRWRPIMSLILACYKNQLSESCPSRVDKHWPVVGSQILMVLSKDPDASRVPSASRLSGWFHKYALQGLQHCLVTRSHILKVWSQETVASRLPSSDQIIHRARSLCPSKPDDHWPEAGYQILTVLSSDLDASRLPSPVNRDRATMPLEGLEIWTPVLIHHWRIEDPIGLSFWYQELVALYTGLNTRGELYTWRVAFNSLPMISNESGGVSDSKWQGWWLDILLLW